MHVYIYGEPSKVGGVVKIPFHFSQKKDKFCKVTLLLMTKFEYIIAENIDFISKIKANFYKTAEFGYDVHNSRLTDG